jgi:bla regulator protein blaR1
MALRSFHCKPSLFGKYSLPAAALVAIVALRSLGPLCRAQAVAAPQYNNVPHIPLIPPTHFDVATIKPDKGDDRTMLIFAGDNTWSLKNLPIEMLLKQAFGLEDDRLMGIPGWVKTERFDIQAKLTGPDAADLRFMTIDQRRTMLVSLLTDRFGLKFHHENRQLQEYALVIARGGSKLKESGEGSSEVNGNQVQHLQRLGYGHLDAQGISIERLIGAFTQIISGTIVDETGLTGSYDVALRWTPQMDTSTSTTTDGNGQPSSDGTLPPENLGPPFFTALKEQLGLELKSQKGTVDVIVIDHIEHPTPN